MPGVITSIAPVTGAPGTVITVTGSGFDPTAQAGCPTLVDTTYLSGTGLQATIPADLTGPEGGSMIVVVFVQNADSSISNIVQFTVLFPAIALQSWTTIDAVVGEIPNFQRGGTITDQTINNWVRSIAQTVSSCLLRRGLPLDPTQWQQPDAVSSSGAASPSPQAVLEQINRYGAAARLGSAVSAQFSGGGEWGLAKDLAAAYAAELKLLMAGEYDKLFSPAAATVESGQQVETGQISTFSGGSGQAFWKEQRF